MTENRTFAEIQIGDTAAVSAGLTKAELEGFAAVSGDFNPTHLNEEHAGAHGLRAPVAHGMWTASLISCAVAALYAHSLRPASISADQPAALAAE